jgi:hypothetical protein
MKALPRLGRPDPDKILELVDARRGALEQAIGHPIGDLLSCGGFGCAFVSDGPWAIKLTRDILEGHMWQRWLELQQTSVGVVAGTTVAHSVMQLHGTPADPLYAIVRERVDFRRAPRFAWKEPWGQQGSWWLGPKEYMDLYEIVTDYSGLAEDFAETSKRLRQAAWKDPGMLDELTEHRDELFSYLLVNARAIGKLAPGLGAALVVLTEHGIPPADVYPRNIGMRSDPALGPPGLVLFDPGNTPGGTKPVRSYRLDEA